MFNLIVADPPFIFSDKLNMSSTKRGSASQYDTLSIEDIKSLSIPIAEDALLALWVPSSLLQDGLDIMKAWGFRQTQTFIWVKNKKEPLSSLKGSKDLDKDLDNFDLNNVLSFYMGRLFRQTHELCLIGVKGNIYQHLKNKSQRSVHFGFNMKHSAKPEDLQDRLDLMFPDKALLRLELFARRDRPGWVCLGNECPATMGQDIRDSLSNLEKK